MQLSFPFSPQLQVLQNPLIAWRWGLATGNRRRFSEAAAAALTPVSVFGGLFLMTLAARLAGGTSPGISEMGYLGGAFVFAAQVAFWGAFGFLVLMRIVRVRHDGFARSHVTNLRMAGLSGREILIGAESGRAPGIAATAACYATAMAAGRAILISPAGEGSGFVGWLAAANAGAALTALAIWTAMDTCQWVFGHARPMRLAAAAVLAFAASPLLIYHVVMDGLFGTYYTVYPTNLHAMVCTAEFISWPARFAVVAYIWKRAIGRLEER